MGYADNMRILGNISCGMGSLATYFQNKADGVNSSVAANNMIGNFMNGALRNEAGYYAYKDFGLRGVNDINIAYGYGDAQKNTAATLGILGVVTPQLFFNSFNYNTMYTQTFGMPYMGLGMMGMGGYLC